MQLTIDDVDYAPGDLYDQVPLVINLLRQIPGDDRPDYWLGEIRQPIRYLRCNIELNISHLILAARWEGTQIAPGVEHLPVGIAYVMDNTLLNDAHLDFKKCHYAAIGSASDTSGSKPVKPLTSVLFGQVGRLFGTGNTGNHNA